MAVIDKNSDGVLTETVYYLKKIVKSGFQTLTKIAPSQFGKEFLISLGQELSGQ